jgi:hypothetical protein
MLGKTLELLRLAKEEGVRGEYIDIALGKNKMPTSLKEVMMKFKNKE